MLPYRTILTRRINQSHIAPGEEVASLKRNLQEEQNPSEKTTGMKLYSVSMKFVCRVDWGGGGGGMGVGGIFQGVEIFSWRLRFFYWMGTSGVFVLFPGEFKFFYRKRGG